VTDEFGAKQYRNKRSRAYLNSNNHAPHLMRGRKARAAADKKTLRVVIGKKNYRKEGQS